MTTEARPKIEAPEVSEEKLQAFREKEAAAIGIIGSNKITQADINEDKRQMIHDTFEAFDAEDLNIQGAPAGEEILAGAIPANAVKVSVKTLIGNITDRSVNLNALGAGVLTSGDAVDSWKGTGSGYRVLDGDLTIGDKSRTDQIRQGQFLNQSALDDDRSFAVLGKDWSEIQLLTRTIFTGGSWTLVPQRDTNKMFVFRDTTAASFDIVLPTLDGPDDHYQFDGFKAMFVNLATADYKLNIVAVAGDIAGHTGNVVLSRGACVVLRAVPRSRRAAAGFRYILTPKFGTIA